MIRFETKCCIYFSVLITLSQLFSCANMSSPSGGAYDFDPPKLMKANPSLNATHVNNSKIVLEFDENVIVNDPTEKVIITPPQTIPPQITAVNKKITVQLQDSLIPNTTYTIDFTDAVSDNNENNALENFSISFSTGDYVDSLAISGRVLQADNLETVKGMYVGLHSDLSDSAFTTTKFLRISRTNDKGEFTIKGVAPGEYKIYALDDKNRDFRYDNPSEAIAFLDDIIIPSFEETSRIDTVYVQKGDSNVIDTIKTVQFNKFIPDNIVLRSFSSNFKRQYLQKHERPQMNKLELFFGAPTEMPIMKPLNFDGKKDWFVLEKNVTNDSITYWIKDKAIASMDTLSFEISYLKTDSLNQPVAFLDTLNFMDRNAGRKQNKNKNKKEENDTINFLNLNTNLNSQWDTYRNITFEFNEPLVDSLEKVIVFEQLIDTIYSPTPFTLIVDSLNPRKYTLQHKWKYNEEFKISIDSAAVHSIYGLFNNKFEQKFKVKAEDQYAALAIHVYGIDSVPSFIELLDSSDKPVRKAKVKDQVALFRDLNPGKYYMRIILDENDNGVWDTGDYSRKIQPEEVYYYNGSFDLKAYFEVEHDWTINKENMKDQKPMEIRKNKPQEKSEARKKLEEEQKNKKAQQSRNSQQSVNGYTPQYNPL